MTKTHRTIGRLIRGYKKKMWPIYDEVMHFSKDKEAVRIARNNALTKFKRGLERVAVARGYND